MRRHWRLKMRAKHFTIYMGNLAYLHYSNSLRGIWKLYQDWYHSLNGNMDKVFPLMFLVLYTGFCQKNMSAFERKKCCSISSPEIFQGWFQWKEWKKWIHMERNASIWKYQSLPIPRFEIVKTSAFFFGFFEVWAFQVWSSGSDPRVKMLGATLSQPSLMVRRGWRCFALLMPQRCREIPNDFSRWKFDFAGFPWHLLNTWWLSVRISLHFFQLGFLNQPSTIWDFMTPNGFYGWSIRMQRSNRTEVSTTPYLLNLHGKVLNLQCQLQEADSTHLWDGRGHCTDLRPFPPCLGLAPASC